MLSERAKQAAHDAKTANDTLAAAQLKTQEAEQKVIAAAEAKSTAETTLTSARLEVDAAKENEDAVTAVASVSVTVSVPTSTVETVAGLPATCTSKVLPPPTSETGSSGAAMLSRLATCVIVRW